MIHIIFSEFSRKWAYDNYYHFMIDCLRPLYNYMGINNLNESDIIIYYNNKEFILNIIKELGFKIKPLNQVSDTTVKICKLQYTQVKYIINRFNLLIKPLYNKEKIILIKRDHMRMLLNHSELLKSLDIFKNKYDIEEVIFDNKTLDQQINIMSNCKILIGPHGAGFTNMLFMNENSYVFELFPESFYAPYYKYLANKKDINYYYLHGKDITPPLFSLEYYLSKFKMGEIFKDEDLPLMNLICEEKYKKLDTLVRDIKGFSINIEDVINYIKTIA